MIPFQNGRQELGSGEIHKRYITHEGYLIHLNRLFIISQNILVSTSGEKVYYERL